jgi:predicted ester cyclase
MTTQNPPTIPAADRPQATQTTLAEQNEALFRRWIEAYNDRDDQREADARAAGYIAHAPGEAAPLDAEAWTEMLAAYSTGFPDIHLAVEEVAADEQMVAARMSFTGTHTGEFQGIPPTGRKVAFGSVEINRMVDGKVAEHWFQLDQVAVLQQLGLVIIPGPRLLARIVFQQLKKLGSNVTRRAG